MIQKLDIRQLMECYEDVLKMGIEGLKDLELKHILQLNEYADHEYLEGVKFCICMTQAEIKSLPEGITEENELQYFIDTSYDTRRPQYVLKIIEKYFELKQEQIKAENQANNDEQPSNAKIIIQFGDIIEKKFKDIENDIFALLGNHFPEFYDSEGKALNNKRNIKAIINSWFKLLKTESIITINPTKGQKEQICNVLIAKCKFSDGKLSTKTLFDLDGIEINPLFKKEYTELKNAIKALKIN